MVVFQLVAALPSSELSSRCPRIGDKHFLLLSFMMQLSYSYVICSPYLLSNEQPHGGLTFKRSPRTPDRLGCVTQNLCFEMSLIFCFSRESTLRASLADPHPRDLQIADAGGDGGGLQVVNSSRRTAANKPANFE
jgi:hypothetical protein